MSEVKNKKKKSSMIQVSIGVLAVILAILIIIMMGIVSDIQGTARIVNYTCLLYTSCLAVFEKCVSVLRHHCQ